VTTKEGNCTENGEQTRTCSACGATDTKTIAASGQHQVTDGEIIHEPTCTEAGGTYQFCYGCNQWILTEVGLDPLEHDVIITHTYSQGVLTCTRKCARDTEAMPCGYGGMVVDSQAYPMPDMLEGNECPMCETIINADIFLQ